METRWYPGHMKKTREILKDNLRLVNVVIEILDARIPFSSQNPDLKRLMGNKKRVIVLNKRDLADDNLTSRWLSFFKGEGILAVSIDSIKGQGMNKLKGVLKGIKEEGKRGKRPLRALVAGVPNVGKSSFINSLVGRSVAKTGGKPGVTRGKQWIKISRGIELLDTPGILWPQVEKEEVIYLLAITGAIKFEQLDPVDLAYRLMEYLIKENPGRIKNRYNLEDISFKDLEGIFKAIGQKRGFLKSGGEVDYFKTSQLILKEFREGHLGKITLEEPPHEFSG